MAKARKRKLNSKQLKQLSLLISVLGFIFMLLYGAISDFPESKSPMYWIMCGILFSILVYIIFYYFIFQGIFVEREEQLKKHKESTVSKLSYINFRQVYFSIDGNNFPNLMLMQILKKEKCRFYAKLNEKQCIELKVKNKYNEEVFSMEINNFEYFNRYFKLNQ